MNHHKLIPPSLSPESGRPNVTEYSLAQDQQKGQISHMKDKMSQSLAARSHYKDKGHQKPETRLKDNRTPGKCQNLGREKS